MRTGVPTPIARRVRETGISERGDRLSIRFLSAEDYRYTPVLSRRQGTSVERNRVKRVIRELMRTAEGRYPSGRYMVFVRGQCADFDRTAAANELDLLAGRLASVSQPAGTPS